MKTSFKTLSPTVAIVMLLVAALAFTPTTDAFASTKGGNMVATPDKSEQLLMNQLERMLRSGDQQTRANAMQDIIGLINRPNQNPSFVRWTPSIESTKPIDFRPLTPALLAVYAADPNPSVRTMAAVTLHAVGDEAAMQQLWTLNVMERSPVVKKRAELLLGNYFARVYPELQGDLKITSRKVKKAQHAQRRAAKRALAVDY